MVYGLVEESLPLSLGVILGDLFHDARSALDHLVWQLVLLNEETPQEGPDGNSWPFTYSKSGWQKAKRTNLQGVSSNHKATISRGQPYKAPPGTEYTYPATLQSLSNIDKHQVVHPAYAVIDDPGDALDFVVTEGPGQIVRSQFLARARFEHQAPLLRAMVEGASAETKVDVEGDIPVQVAFGEALTPVSSVAQIVAWVGVVLKTFDPDFRS